MAECSLGSVVGRFDARRGHEAPAGVVQSQQVATHIGSVGAGAQDALGQPITDMTLNGREFGQERRVWQGSIPHPSPQDQQVFVLEFEVVADGVGLVAPLQDP